MVKELVVTVALFASVTLTLIAFADKGPDGVPLITPVLVLRPRPVGNEPLAIENTFVPAPPAVASVSEYALPLVAARPVVGVVMVMGVRIPVTVVAVLVMGVKMHVLVGGGDGDGCEDACDGGCGDDDGCWGSCDGGCDDGGGCEDACDCGCGDGDGC
jgi:hypothetical protein